MKFYRVSGRENCQHESLIFLGSDRGENKYFKCRNCGGVIIKVGRVGREKKKNLGKYLKSFTESNLKFP